MQRRTLQTLALSLVLAITLHADWHLARHTHHRLSFGWSYHWLATAVVFGLVGWTIARKWPATRWRLGAVAFIAAIVLAQGVEPFFESVVSYGRAGYEVSPERWAAFGRAIGAAALTYWSAVWLGVRRPREALKESS
jgi:hypothetical protein